MEYQSDWTDGRNPDQVYSDLVSSSVLVLKENEPSDGYYLAFSGGKDSCVIKRLAEMSGVKFNAFYNNTTIDPPELVKFIRTSHADVKWNNPKMNMMLRVATRPGFPPVRRGRWCCSEYKEVGGGKQTKIVGVRWAESNARRRRWNNITEHTNGAKVVCPIVDWTDVDVWRFIKENNIPYCKLYDEGWERLGCIGCPLQSKEGQEREFKRWPKYEENWKKAIIKNWENFHGELNKKGNPYAHSKIHCGEDLYNWWLTEKRPDYMSGDCQTSLLFTNEDVSDIEGEK